MSKNSSFYAAFMCILCCSAAVALQPTVRAGSISLNSGIKPSAGNITSTTTSNTNVSTDSTRGSALTKFTAGNVVPVSRPSNNNNTQPSSTALDELRTAIDNLRAAQLRLENDQLTRSQVEDAIEDTVKSLDLTTTNTPLKNTLSELRSSTQNLQSDIATLQDFNEDLDVNLDNRLKVRGLIGGDNRPPFATKTEIEPTVLAQKIVTDVNATETLSNKIKPKTEDIQAIIRQDLIDKEILTGSGALNVEKKGEVQVTEATVTNVLRNSDNFKQMVSDEVASKGYVTNDALNNKKFLSTDSATFNTLATKTDIAPATIAAGIADSESAKQALAEAMAGKIGPNEAGVKGLISNELQRLQIIDGSDQLKVASTTSVDPVTIARSIAKSADAKAELSGQIGPNTDTVDNLITQKLKDKGLVDNDARRAVLTSAELETTLASKKYATTDDLPTVDEATISAALANSQTLDNTIVQNLVNKRLLKENGDLNVAPVSIVNTVNTLNGGINDDGSLLQRIATDETLRNALKGEDGKDGSGFTFKGNITSYSELSSKTKAQGDAWYNEGDTLLYICSCDTNGANCAYPANGKGVPFRGEKGDKGDPGTPGTSAETVWYSYCTNGTNLNNIIRPLYGTSKTCDGDNAFTEEEYNALMDGSKAYCMLIAKNAREKSDYLVASKGMGKTLENIFGTGTVNNLKNNGLSASVSINGTSKKFVFACAEKYDEIMNPKSAWYSYCSEGNNLATIIQQLYDNVETCDDFTQEQYNALMGGPRAYCLSVAKNVDLSTINVKNNLKRLFGDSIISTLSSQKVATKVTLNGQHMTFVDACAQKYEEIMAGKSGEGYLYRGTIDNYSELANKSCDAEHEADAYYNLEIGDALLYICACNDNKTSCSFPVKGKGVNFKGDPGENGKPASQIYCEAHAVNYPDDVTNLTLIQKLYPNKGISSCDPSVFTQDLYAAIIGGANAYCTSLNATFNTGVSLNEGIGLKLARIYATKKNVSLTSAKSALQVLQNKDAKQRMNDSDFSILDECIANYNSIMSGDDAEKPEVAYCKAEAEHYNDGTLNRDLARKLFPNKSISDDCSDFTTEMYAKMVGGADAFCANLTATFNEVSLDDGVGLKMAKLYMNSNTDVKDLASAKTALRSALITNKTPAQRLNIKIFNGKSLLEACIANYNSIMSGDDAETVWHAYCMETDDNNVSNLTKIITPLYSNVTSCDQFTSAQYNAIMGGARAYCLSLTQDIVAGKMTDFDTGIGKRLTAQLAGGNKSKLSGLRNQNLASVLSANSDSFRFNGKSLVKACEEKYNEIMAGADGQDAKPVEQQYCEDNIEIVKKLYSKITSTDDCESKFTNADYTAIMGGARAYCLSLVQNPSTLNLSEGIGKRLSDKLGKTAMTAFVDTNTYKTPQSRMALTGFAGKNSTNTTFMTACEARYDEIMAGADGKDGIDGDDGDDAATVWCKAHMSTGAARLTPAKMLRVYDKSTTRAAKITISNNAGYFTDLATCLAAVAADPDLMGGESASDQDFNSKNTITALNSTSFGRFNSHRNGFVASLQGADGKDGTNGKDGANGKDGKDGQDGITYAPVISKEGLLSWKNARTNEDIKDIEAVIIKGDKGDQGNPGKTMIPTMGSDGTISWRASTETSPSASSFNVKTAAVDAVKASMGGNSNSTWDALIGDKALTVNDLKNLVTSGALAVDATSGNVKFTSSVNNASALSDFRTKAGGNITSGNITSTPLKVTVSSGGSVTGICSGTSCQTMTASSNTGNDSEAFGDISDDPNFP